MKTNNKLDADIIIVGAGIVGYTSAYLLSQAGLRVILLETNKAISKHKDPRVFSITMGSEKILRRIGAWDLLKEQDISCFRKMHVWDENSFGEVCFDSASICQPTMGYIISYQAIIKAMQKRLPNAGNVNYVDSTSLLSIEKKADSISLALENGKVFCSKLLIAADGKNSKTRQLAQIDYVKKDYNQSAISCVVSTEHPHNEIARQRFLKLGPLAFLPMKNQHKSIVIWSTSPNQAKSLSTMSKAEFHLELAKSFSYELGSIKESEDRFVFPLSRAAAECYTQTRFALIGDSAHAIHPLAGLGANMGLLDAAALSEIVIKAHYDGKDLGHWQVLRQYERWRKGQNKSVMYLMDGFKYLFENQDQFVRLLRNIGLNIVDDLPCMKRVIMERAMGLKGDLPSFAR